MLIKTIEYTIDYISKTKSRARKSHVYKHSYQNIAHLFRHYFWPFLVGRNTRKLWKKINHNSKNKNCIYRKNYFAYVSTHCASFIKIWPFLRGVLHILTWDRVYITKDRVPSSNYFWHYVANKSGASLRGNVTETLSPLFLSSSILSSIISTFQIFSSSYLLKSNGIWSYWQYSFCLWKINTKIIIVALICKSLSRLNSIVQRLPYSCME